MGTKLCGRGLANGSEMGNKFLHNNLLEGDIAGIIGMSWGKSRKYNKKRGMKGMNV
jgi:hypothetical protein